MPWCPGNGFAIFPTNYRKVFELGELVDALALECLHSLEQLYDLLVPACMIPVTVVVGITNFKDVAIEKPYWCVLIIAVKFILPPSICSFNTGATLDESVR